MSATSTSFALDSFSTRSLHGSAHEFGDDSYVPQDAAVAAGLESQRTLDFLSDATPTYMRGESVGAATRRMAESIQEFDLAFGRDGNRARL